MDFACSLLAMGAICLCVNLQVSLAQSLERMAEKINNLRESVGLRKLIYDDVSTLKRVLASTLISIKTMAVKRNKLAQTMKEKSFKEK